MSDSNADGYLRVQEQMEGTRGTWDNHWAEVARYVRPNQDLFNQWERTDGDKRTLRIFDDTAQLALPKFAAAVISMAFPATQTYHRMTTPHEKLQRNASVQRYFETINNILFRVRYGPHANFQSQSGEVILDLGAFGNGILFTDDVLGIGIRYKSIPLPEAYFAEDPHGRIDRLHRRFQFTAHQAMTMFDRRMLSPEINRAYEKSPLQKFWFLHCVAPNEEYRAAQPLHPVRGKRFHSCYIERETRTTVDEGGYRTFPFAVMRYETAPREVYGRGPAMKVLPTIKSLQEMMKTTLRAGQLAVAPPIMLTEDASLSGFDLRSNALNHGYLDDQNRARAQPFNSGAKVEYAEKLLSDQRAVVNDAFLVTLFRILVDQPQITATEAMLRAQEKGQLLAPTMGRAQAELLGSIVERELDILTMNGALPPMPRELIEAGGEYKIEYQSPLNQAQRAGAGIAILNTWQAVAPLAQIDKTVLALFDTHESARIIAESNGYPQSALRSEDEVAVLAEKQAQDAQTQQLINAAPVAAGAARDLAQASALAGSAPGQIAPNLGLPTGA